MTLFSCSHGAAPDANGGVAFNGPTLKKGETRSRKSLISQAKSSQEAETALSEYGYKNPRVDGALSSLH